jgi:hypothetical protein
MNWNKHSRFEGAHAFLGASKYSWLNYDDEKFIEAYSNQQAIYRGTRLHALAAELISLGIPLKGSHQTLNMYVNDAIGYKMDPEVVLYYSDNFFGTADSISFRNGRLRIHDLKTGQTPAHMEQLMIYAALFCLEYHQKPGELQMELRIYQNNDIIICTPTAEDILPIMDKGVHYDKLINKLKEME